MRTIAWLSSPALVLLAGCGAVEPEAAALRSRLSMPPPAQVCKPRTSEVTYLGPCRIGPGGSYILSDTDEECRVIRTSATTWGGMLACLEVSECLKRICLSAAPFAQAPSSGTAATAESANPNMVGD